MPRETVAVSAHALCTPYNHAPVHSATSRKASSVGFACVFSCNLPPAIFRRMTWTVYVLRRCGNTGCNGYRHFCCFGSLRLSKTIRVVVIYLINTTVRGVAAGSLLRLLPPVLFFKHVFRSQCWVSTPVADRCSLNHLSRPSD